MSWTGQQDNVASRQIGLAIQISGANFCRNEFKCRGVATHCTTFLQHSVRHWQTRSCKTLRVLYRASSFADSGLRPVGKLLAEFEGQMHSSCLATASVTKPPRNGPVHSCAPFFAPIGAVYLSSLQVCVPRRSQLAAISGPAAEHHRQLVSALDCFSCCK